MGGNHSDYKPIFEQSYLKEVALRYKTPVYIYSGRKIIEKIEALRKPAPSNFKIYYAIKANPSLGILQLIANQNLGAEVSSSGEVLAAVTAGFDPKDLLYTGPGKTSHEVKTALTYGVELFSVESENQLELLNELASEHKKTINVLLRVNPDVCFGEADLKMSGVCEPFGIDELSMDGIIEREASFIYCRIIGLHMHVASEVIKTSVYIENIKKILDTVKRLKKKYNVCTEIINIGGGLGIPYFPGDGMGLQLNEIWRNLKEDIESFNNSSFIIEPGRFIVSESGVFLTSVVDVKYVKGKKFVIVDGGVNNKPALSLKAVLSRQRPNIEIADKARDGCNVEKTDIRGPLLTPKDILASNIDMPRDIKSGDVLVFFNTGAYALTTSSLHFLSRPFPAEILVNNGKEFVIRERGDERDFLTRQNIISL